eukprot:scaffold5551_cov119-Isochrysis_galbana.AAC.1
MTDPPTDDTEAREQDAPGINGAKHRAPLHLHGHTGAVPPDKALSDSSAQSQYSHSHSHSLRGSPNSPSGVSALLGPSWSWRHGARAPRIHKPQRLGTRQ